MTHITCYKRQWYSVQQCAIKGPSIKYVMLKGDGVREGVTVCDRGREGVKSM